MLLEVSWSPNRDTTGYYLQAADGNTEKKYDVIILIITMLQIQHSSLAGVPRLSAIIKISDALVWFIQMYCRSLNSLILARRWRLISNNLFKTIILNNKFYHRKSNLSLKEINKVNVSETGTRTDTRMRTDLLCSLVKFL